MLGILLPVVVGLAAGAAWLAAKKPPNGVMTPERQSVLDTAMQSNAEPDALRKLAQVFRDVGLPLQADLLEKRAKLRELPADVKESRKAAYRAAMASTNPAAIRAVADEFEKEGSIGAAATLRTYAFSLEHPDQASAGLGTPGVQSATMNNPAPGPAAAAQAAADLVKAQQGLPDPTSSFADATAAAAAMQAQLAQAALDAGDHPESSAAAVAIADLTNPGGN